MSREDAQFKLRLPADLREQVEQSAKNNRRSINAEIVARLEEGFLRGLPSESGGSAAAAQPFSDEALEQAVLKAFVAVEGRLSLRAAPEAVPTKGKPKG